MSKTGLNTLDSISHRDGTNHLAIAGRTPVDDPVQMWCRPDGDLVSGTEAMRMLAEEGEDPDTMIRRFGDWCVTDYGLQCLSHPYEIPASRLWEDNWVRHMGEKTWPVIAHFASALEFARAYHRSKRRGGGDG
jgi:hypothetical protein